MSKELKVNVEMGLCTKEMAKENPIKDFEILIEEYKQKWSKQMYDYFKECLNEIKKNEQALEIIKKHKLLNYVLKNKKCAKMYHLSQEDEDALKEILL